MYDDQVLNNNIRACGCGPRIYMPSARHSIYAVQPLDYPNPIDHAKEDQLSLACKLLSTNLKYRSKCMQYKWCTARIIMILN